jgi:hypothetical protein
VTAERRKTSRLKLRLPVLLFPSDGRAAMKTETVDISADGFYCTAAEPFAPGSRVRFVIALPSTTADGSISVKPKLYMDGYADVVRVICELQSGFGLGFHITEYRVIEDVNHLGPAIMV